MPLVLLRTVLQFLDLGQPFNSLYIFSNPSSMIAVGSAIIVGFLIVGVVHFGLWIWPFRLLERAVKARRLLGLVGVVFAFGVALYVGVLLGVLAAVPLWNNSLLPVLFLVSAISTGLASVIFGLAFLNGRAVGVELENIHDSIMRLARANVVLLGVELFLLAMYLMVVQSASPVAGVSVQLLVTGYLAPFFWVGLVLFGLMFPLALNLLGQAKEGAMKAGRSVLVYMLSSVLVLTGSLTLSYLVLAAGVPVTYAPMFGTEPFFTIPAFLGYSGSDLTSLVPGIYEYFSVGAFFVLLLIVYAIGSIIPASRASTRGGN